MIGQKMLQLPKSGSIRRRPCRLFKNVTFTQREFAQSFLKYGCTVSIVLQGGEPGSIYRKLYEGGIETNTLDEMFRKISTGKFTIMVTYSAIEGVINGFFKRVRRDIHLIIYVVVSLIKKRQKYTDISKDKFQCFLARCLILGQTRCFKVRLVQLGFFSNKGAFSKIQGHPAHTAQALLTQHLKMHSQIPEP